jgi:LysM domain
MSIRGAAVARQTSGTVQGVSQRQLRIVPPVLGGNQGHQAAGWLGGGAGAAEPGPAPSGRPDVSRATRVHVREVRVVREVSVRALGASRSRSRTRAADSRVRAATIQTRPAPPAPQDRPLPPRPGPVRLTRRGRRVVAGFAILGAVVLAMLFWLVVAGSVQASSHGLPPGSAEHGMTQIVVRPGQTLWSIAAAAEPAANPWLVVQQIIDINALSGATVHAGQLLWVPMR